eukprot:3306586-Pleurochrysis_carterae.AAC.2
MDFLVSASLGAADVVCEKMLLQGRLRARAARIPVSRPLGPSASPYSSPFLSPFQLSLWSARHRAGWPDDCLDVHREPAGAERRLRRGRVAALPDAAPPLGVHAHRLPLAPHRPHVRVEA